MIDISNVYIVYYMSINKFVCTKYIVQLFTYCFVNYFDNISRTVCPFHKDV